jgi:hypothetical protein
MVTFVARPVYLGQMLCSRRPHSRAGVVVVPFGVQTTTSHRRETDGSPSGRHHADCR